MHPEASGTFQYPLAAPKGGLGSNPQRSGFSPSTCVARQLLQPNAVFSEKAKRARNCPE